MKIGMPHQIDITTKATAGEITVVYFVKPVYYIYIENKSSTYTLYVSFDYGESWIDIATSKTIEFEPLSTSGEKPAILIKSDGASQPARIIYREVLSND